MKIQWLLKQNFKITLDLIKNNTSTFKWLKKSFTNLKIAVIMQPFGDDSSYVIPIIPVT